MRTVNENENIILVGKGECTSVLRFLILFSKKFLLVLYLCYLKGFQCHESQYLPKDLCTMLLQIWVTLF